MENIIFFGFSTNITDRHKHHSISTSIYCIINIIFFDKKRTLLLQQMFNINFVDTKDGKCEHHSFCTLSLFYVKLKVFTLLIVFQVSFVQLFPAVGI